MTKDYPLTQIAGFPANAKLSVDGSTEADVLAALAANTPLPPRDLALGRIGVDFAGKTDTPVKTPLGGVTISAAAHARLGVGVCDKSATVLAQLALADADDLKLAWADAPGQRYAYLVGGYDVNANLSGTHAVGALGKATFGVDAKQSSALATVASFAAGAGADDVLKQLVAGWRLPATINDATDLAPGTSVLVEIDGSLGLKLGAQLGYDFSFVRAVQAGGLSGDLGLKVATALTTQLGFNASGKFLLWVERPSAALALRLRLFKLRKKGWTFALNLTVGATPVTPLPDTIDDFVEAVFGVQGKQVIADLKKLEEWTDPTKSAGDIVAGLAHDKVLALIKDTTGFDPATEFTKARQKFLDGIGAWHALPGRASAWLWQTTTAGLAANDRTTLKNAVAALAATGDAAVKKFVADQVAQAGFDQRIVGQFIDSLAEDGVLALLERAPEVRQAAQSLQKLLEGDFLEKLQQQIEAALGLDQIVKAVTKTDWDKVDGWLLDRLSKFFGETLQFNKLDEIRGTLNTVIGKRDQLYHALHEAVTKTYEAKFAYAYESATTKTALIDAKFDFSEPRAQAAFLRIVASGAWDDLFLAPIPGVTLASGVLTHGIARKTSVQFTLPMFTSSYTDVVSSLAKLEVHTEGTELVGAYTLNASDETKSIGHFQSRLGLTARYSAAAQADARLHIHGAGQSAWTQQYRQVLPRAKFAELEFALTPIQSAYFAAQFAPPAQSLHDWLFAFDDQVEKVLHNGANEFGDVLLGLEVRQTGDILAAWTQPRDARELLRAQCAVSRAIQLRLRELMLDTYLQDLADVAPNNDVLRAFLVHAALPVVNHASYEPGDDSVTLDATKPYWDSFDPELVRAMATLGFDPPQRPAAALLSPLLARAQARLIFLGRTNDAQWFEPRDVGDVLTRACPSDQTLYDNGPLARLLFVESTIITGAMTAVAHATRFANEASTPGANPAALLAALAQFGADLTTTFNAKLHSFYLPSSIRSVGAVVFAAATEALYGLDAASPAPEAVLALTVVRPGAKFPLADFLQGKKPTDAADIACEQRLVQNLQSRA